MSTDTREERLERRISDLYATDQQFADARPSEAIARRSKRPSCGCRRSCAPSSTATPTGPRSGSAPSSSSPTRDGPDLRELLPRFDTITYRELSDRVVAVAAALTHDSGAARRSGRHPRLHQHRLHDRRHGAAPPGGGIGSPADQRTGHPAATHRRRDRAGRDRVEHRLPRRRRRTRADRPPPRAAGRVRLPREVDDHRDALAAAPRGSPKPSPVVVETLAEVLARGNALPAAPAFDSGDDDHAGAADLHLRQHRHAQGRDVHQKAVANIVAPVQHGDVGQ